MRKLKRLTEALRTPRYHVMSKYCSDTGVELLP